MIVKKLENPGRVLPKEKAVKMKSGLVVLAPGEEVGEHVTEAREELIIFLKGKAEVFSESEKSEVEAPAAVYIEPEKKHNVINAGEGELRYVYTVAFI